jgi:penicillin amidase
MRRWIRRIAVLLLVLVLAAAVVLVIDLRNQLPDRSVPRLPGLSSPVEVSFDARGIPTVRARTLRDAFRVEVYLQARERLFQMELARRVAGASSPSWWCRGAPLDRRQRVYGFARVAEEAVRTAPDDQRADAQALADGINAFIASHRGRWGIEFQMLGLEPRPWKPADTIRLVLLLHQQLSESWQTDLVNETLAALPRPPPRLPHPEVSSDDVLVLPDADPRPLRARPPSSPGAPPAPALVPPRLDPPLEVLGVPLEPWSGAAPPDVGSNAWVLAGAHTARGKPILANDPHLGFGMPGTWYPPHRAGRWERSGAAVDAGRHSCRRPGLVIFQNDRRRSASPTPAPTCRTSTASPRSASASRPSG